MRIAISLFSRGLIFRPKRKPQAQGLEHVRRRCTDIVTGEQHKEVDRDPFVIETVELETLDFAIRQNPCPRHEC